MPLTDLPPDALYTYTGRNPRPSDFDEFWDDSLNELHHTDPQVEWAPAVFQTEFAQCQHLFFTGTGGARIHAKVLSPRYGHKCNPAICIFHGYTSHSDDWFNLLAWVACGFTVAALDCRGQGGLSDDPIPVKGGTVYGHVVKGIDDSPDKLYFRNVFLDCARLVSIVQSLDSVDPLSVMTYGDSQGGALALVAAALTPSVCKCVSIYPFLSDYKRVWEMDLARTGAYVGITDYFIRFDPLHEREDRFFLQLGYIDVQHLACRIRAKVLMACGLMDNICPPSTQFAIYNKIESPKKIMIYPDYGHARLKGFADSAIQFLLCDATNDPSIQHAFATTLNQNNHEYETNRHF